MLADRFHNSDSALVNHFLAPTSFQGLLPHLVQLSHLYFSFQAALPICNRSILPETAQKRGFASWSACLDVVGCWVFDFELGIFRYRLSGRDPWRVRQLVAQDLGLLVGHGLHSGYWRKRLNLPVRVIFISVRRLSDFFCGGSTTQIHPFVHFRFRFSDAGQTYLSYIQSKTRLPHNKQPIRIQK